MDFAQTHSQWRERLENVIKCESSELATLRAHERTQRIRRAKKFIMYWMKI